MGCRGESAWEASARVRSFLPSSLVPHLQDIFPCGSRSAPPFLNQTHVKMEPLHSVSPHSTNQTDPKFILYSALVIL
jgi:hypothetical protein